jgi:hypothetical protein
MTKYFQSHVKLMRYFGSMQQTKRSQQMFHVDTLTSKLSKQRNSCSTVLLYKLLAPRRVKQIFRILRNQPVRHRFHNSPSTSHHPKPHKSSPCHRILFFVYILILSPIHT